MCGLAGSFTQDSKHPLTEKQRLRRARVLEGLLVANASRGTDATGVATICDDERCVYKKAVPSYKFVDDKQARKHLRTESPLIIGHTRYGTTGKNTDENAHPFAENNIIGAHNGVISNYTSIDSALRDAKEIATKDYDFVQVDSQAVFRYLDHVGPEGYIEALSKVRGSAALTWHDARSPDSLWIIRHSNPINLAFVPGMNTLFWSSQYDHLSSVLWGVFGDNWFSVGTKEDRLYEFRRDDVLDFKDWPVTFTTYNTYGHGGGVNDWEGTWRSSWDDPDEDANVKHPYAVATVTRKDEGKGKDGASSATPAGATRVSGDSDTLRTTTSGPSLSGSGMENVLTVLNRMGVPFDMEDESPLDVSDSRTSSSEGALAPFDDMTCTVCMESIEDVDVGRYYERTGSWVCTTCVSFWEDEGQGNLLEAMGHA